MIKLDEIEAKADKSVGRMDDEIALLIRAVRQLGAGWKAANEFDLRLPDPSLEEELGWTQAHMDMIEALNHIDSDVLELLKE